MAGALDASLPGMCAIDATYEIAFELAEWIVSIFWFKPYCLTIRRSYPDLLLLRLWRCCLLMLKVGLRFATGGHGCTTGRLPRLF